MSLKEYLSLQRWTRRRFSIASGERWYAIGDVHGCLDLLNHLFRLIDDDDERRASADTRLIFLGDYIDRGPDSRRIIELMMKLDMGDDRVVFLMGNHEEVLLATIQGNRKAAALFHRMGGRETLLSYGVSARDYDHADSSSIIDMTRSQIPQDHVEWIRNLRSSHAVGDYLFVHAGVRPGIAVHDQNSSDMRWIRQEFLDCALSFGPMVIHGHSVSTEIDKRPNRIGIDTGAYLTGRLTAIGLEGSEQWFLQTSGAPGR